MGFQFGVVRELDFQVTLYCFTLVVAFVIISEYVLGVVEYFMEGSRLYSRMLKMIYKELMIMGMLTFCVMMYEASPEEENDPNAEHWLAAIDFSHVYLFFVTFFFVLHAFYLMIKSATAASEYRLLFSESTTTVIDRLRDAKKSWLGSWLFSMKLLPISSARYHAEFSMIQSLFMRLYRLPENLDFPYYLSGCFDRFALATINRSVFTWVVLLFFVICNYVRIRYNLTEAIFALVFDSLGWQVSEVTGLSDRHLTFNETLYVFSVCGIFLVLYTVAMTIVSRIYKARLVDRVYPDHDSIDDYIALLRAKEFEQAHPSEAVQRMRISSSALKKEIEIEFDVQEEAEDEDAEGMKYLAETLLSTYKYLDELCSDTMVFLRVKAREFCCYSTPPRAADGGMLAAGGGTAKRVIEAKAVHVSLKRRLKFTHDEKMIIAGRVHYTERDGLNGSRYAGYGTDSHMPIYREVPADEHDREESRLVSSGVYRAGQAGHGAGGRGHADRAVTMCSLCNSLVCCSCCVSEWEEANLKTIFMAGKPIWYFRAVELQIMFTCMYMALWATNFVTMVRNHGEFTLAEEASIQLLMLVPILFSFARISYIAQTYSLITAICELNIEALHEVLVNTEDMKAVSHELREKIHGKIRAWARADQPTRDQELLFLGLLFEEVDQDGSGAIDREEFRMLLRKLNLSYSDHRFNLLFRALDSIGGDGMVEEADLVEFMFPTTNEEDALGPSWGAGDDHEGHPHRAPGLHALIVPTAAAHSPTPSTAPTRSTVSSASPPRPVPAPVGGRRDSEVIREDIRNSRALGSDRRFVATVTSAGFGTSTWSR